MSDFRDPQAEREAYRWAAGYLCGQGTFTVMKNKGRPPVVRLQITTTRDTEALKIWAGIMGVSIRPYKKTATGKEGLLISVTGKPLHELMAKLWPYLTVFRRKEYAVARRRLEN